MKDKIFMFVAGLLVGAIIATAVFLIIGNKGKGNFDASKFKNGSMTPPTEFNQDGDFTLPEGMPDNLPEDFKNKDFDPSNAERGNKGNKADKKVETEDKTTTDSQSV